MVFSVLNLVGWVVRWVVSFMWLILFLVVVLGKVDLMGVIVFVV